MAVKYFATLKRGGLYVYKGKRFTRGEKLEVSKSDADYLGSVTDVVNVYDGAGQPTVENRFKFEISSEDDGEEAPKKRGRPRLNPVPEGPADESGEDA